MVSLDNYALYTNPWYMCVALLCGVRYLSMGLHKKEGFDMAHGRMKPNDVYHQGWDVQVQVKHLKKIICLKLVVHLVIMDLWRCFLTKLSHNGLWGSKLKSSPKKQWSSEAFRLDVNMKHHHQDQAGCSKKRYVISTFSFYRSQGVCWETGL
jgi:hypothetical protein